VLGADIHVGVAANAQYLLIERHAGAAIPAISSSVQLDRSSPTGAPSGTAP
jgi:hypothetical protein